MLHSWPDVFFWFVHFKYQIHFYHVPKQKFWDSPMFVWTIPTVMSMFELFFSCCVCRFFACKPIVPSIHLLNWGNWDFVPLHSSLIDKREIMVIWVRVCVVLSWHQRIMPFGPRSKTYKSGKNRGKQCGNERCIFGYQYGCFLDRARPDLLWNTCFVLVDLFVASEGWLHVASVFKLTFKKAPKTSQWEIWPTKRCLPHMLQDWEESRNIILSWLFNAWYLPMDSLSNWYLLKFYCFHKMDLPHSTCVSQW